MKKFTSPFSFLSAGLFQRHLEEKTGALGPLSRSLALSLCLSVRHDLEMLRTALQRSGTALLFSGGSRAIVGEVREKEETRFSLYSRCLCSRFFSPPLES